MRLARPWVLTWVRSQPARRAVPVHIPRCCQRTAPACPSTAHAVGNVALHLHDWDVDFACWCSYKYLNSGPGGIAGIFVHERHADKPDLPRFCGWWGHRKEDRFVMHHNFVPSRGASGWQLSNPPVWQCASLRASLDIFDEATMPALRAKSEKLTG